MSITFQQLVEGKVKGLGISRLELSQFANMPLGEPKQLNLKILRCQVDADAFVSVSISCTDKLSPMKEPSSQ